MDRGNKPFLTVVTDENDNKIFPETWHNGLYSLENKSINDDEIILRRASTISMTKDQKMRIWYSEDLRDYYDFDNSGKHNVFVDLIYEME